MKIQLIKNFIYLKMGFESNRIRMSNSSGICLILVLFLISSCKKNETAPDAASGQAQPSPTSLSITFNDTSGNFISGVTASLYSSLSDWTNRTNQVASSLVSDANGKVTFSANLSPIQYYWWAEKDCQNNFFGLQTTSALTSNANSSVACTLYPTGTLTLTNTASVYYIIGFNGAFAFDMDRGTTKTINYLHPGSLWVRVLQGTGFPNFPIDESFYVNVTCGSIDSISFP